MENEDKKLEVDKEFGLTTLSLKNRTTVVFLTVLIALAGLMAYIQLPKESFPSIKQPIIYVGTSYPGNSPADIENLVTRELEKEINNIAEIDNLKSTSVQDYSTIVVEFDPKVAVEDALNKVKDAVDKAKADLPNDLPSDPNVVELNFSDFPIMNVNLSGPYSMDELKEFAEYLQDEIEKLPEISKADIRGLDEKEVKIKADPYLMEARNVSFSDIENAVKRENITLSGGSILDNGTRRSVRAVGEFTHPKQIEEVVIKNEKGNIVYLRDVAEVEFNYKERTSLARLEGNPTVSVDVVKRAGENLLEATDKINVIIEEAQRVVFPKGLRVAVTNDQSSSTRDMVSSLENNIISGVIVVVFILLLFLGTRNALFVGMAIPLSMLMSFLILGMMGITINTMVLFGLIMALGMLVDNGIVIVENIYRLLGQGYDLPRAIQLGAGEIAMPIISSTATTLAAFVPLALWPGLMGEFMKYLPITLIVGLGSSLFVALVINPVFISIFMKHEDEIKTNNKKTLIMAGILLVIGAALIALGSILFGNLFILFAVLILLDVYFFTPTSNAFQAKLFPKVERAYERLVQWSLEKRRPLWVLLGTTAALIVSGLLLWVFPPKTLYFPENEPSLVNIEVEFPVGTDVEETDAFTKKVEQTAFDLLKPYAHIVKSVMTTVGAGASTDTGQSSAESPQKARITVNFVDFKYREGTRTSKVMEHIRKGIPDYPGVAITVKKDENGPPTGGDIAIEVSGEDFGKLLSTVERMKAWINDAGIQGIEKLKVDIGTGKPELTVRIDREKAGRFGLSTYAISNEIRTSLFGKEVSKFKEGEDDYKIQLRLSDRYRYDVNALMNKSITFRDNADGKMHQVPISSVANAELTSTYGSIKRKNLKRVVTLYSNVLGGFNATEVNQKIAKTLADFSMPVGYSFRFGGEQEKQAEEMSFLVNALIMAVFLIFLIIVAQFNKITAPLIVMTSVLFSTIGVFLGLIIFRMDFVIIMTMIGIISLAGVAVNNAIVLIDFMEIKQERIRRELGVTQLPIDQLIRAIVESGKDRLRPVLLTAITTVLGLIPLAVGINIDFIKFFTLYDPDFYIGGDSVVFWGPLSWTVVYGLVVATFLTLVVVPVMYLLVEKVGRKLAPLLGRRTV